MEQIFAFTECPEVPLKGNEVAKHAQLFLSKEGLTLRVRDRSGRQTEIVLGEADSGRLSAAAAAGAKPPPDDETLARMIDARAFRSSGATHPEIVNGERTMKECAIRDAGRLKRALAESGYAIIGPLD